MATTPVFSDEQIASILDLINTTRHTQYIGARYVPIFGRKGETTIEWDNSAPYEPLTIVLHQGNSYTSRQYVPTGVDILNEDFWANTGNYNAQVEQYRQEVLNFDSRITTAQTAADNAQTTADNAQTTADNAQTAADNAQTTADNAQTAADNAQTTADNAQTTIAIIKSKRYLMFGDSWTVYYNEQLPKKIQQLTSATWVKNFGVSGAVMNDITTKQIPNALNDPTVTDIDSIIIVVGANDIFWGNETLQQIKDAATNMAITLTQNYKSIPIHVFLDSSRTSSVGRINYYKNITDILTNYGITVHEDILYYFWANNGNLYRSDADGRENVLHLSPDGYDKLAGLISAHLMGAPTIGTRVLGQCTPDWLYNIGGASPWSETPPDIEYGIKFSNYAQSKDNSFLTYENGHVYYNFHFLIQWTNQTAPDATGVMELISYPEVGFKTAYDDTKQYITCPPQQLVVGNAFVTNGSDPRYIRTECYARSGANGTTRMTVRLMRESTAQWQKFTDVYGSIEWPMI